jgi:hypothetical protein
MAKTVTHGSHEGIAVAILFVLASLIFQGRVVLWHGTAANFLLVTLVVASAFLGALELVTLSLFGYLVLVGPVFYSELFLLMLIPLLGHVFRGRILQEGWFHMLAFVIVSLVIFYIFSIGPRIFRFPEIFIDDALVTVVWASVTFFFFRLVRWG